MELCSLTYIPSQEVQNEEKKFCAGNWNITEHCSDSGATEGVEGLMTPAGSLQGEAVTWISLSSHGSSGSDGLAYLAIGFLLGLVLIYLGAKKWRVGRLIKNTPTERVRSVAVGRTEVSGTCREAGVTYSQPYADGECLYRHWEVEEYRRSPDPDDNSSEWVVVDSGTNVAPFFIEDDTGQILIDTTEGPYFETSDRNSVSTTVPAGEDPPARVQSFSESSGWEGNESGAIGFSGNSPMGKLGKLFGGDRALEMMQAGEGMDQEQADRQIKQHIDDDVLNEDGRIREDVSEQELMAAVDDDVQEMGPMSFLGGMGTEETDGTPIAGAKGTEARSANNGGASSEATDETEGPPDVVQELGGTGTTGSMGRGASLSRRLIDGALHELSGGRFGSAGSGGDLFGSGRRTRSHNKRRYSHEVLPVEETVYVFGEAQPRDDAAGSNASRLKLGEETATGQFIVSDQSEDGIVSQYSLRGPLFVIVGLLLSAGSLGGLLWALGVA